MGVGGHFWDLLKPYGRRQGFDSLRDKRVAVDLSFWIVQHQTALSPTARIRSPHLRLTFFRTINLFSKFGAFPVFVMDGTPSPLKSRARLARFFGLAGVDASRSLEACREEVSVERNRAFTKCVQECVELLHLLGMPVLKARGEAEALCAQLNSQGHVDACLTADSDAFLFGAKCVIKSIHPNSKEPIECYYISDIEDGLHLKRQQLIAISLLVGNDHDLNGVPGIGIDTALRFVQTYNEDEILNRLHEIGGEDAPGLAGDIGTTDFSTSLDGGSLKIKYPHCSLCGHPGNKRAHLKVPCEYCVIGAANSCIRKPAGFKCACSFCDAGQREKELKKKERWRMKVCQKIAMEQNFPNNKIIDMYMSKNHGYFNDDGPCLSWESPKTDMVVDFLAYHLHWGPSYIRQRMLPLFSTNFLREVASDPSNLLLYGQYEFDSIQRVKIKFGHQFYLVKWRKAADAGRICCITAPEDSGDIQQEEVMETVESNNPFDVIDVPQIHNHNGCCFMLTDESMDLVQAAFPEEANRFSRETELRELRRRNKSRVRSEGGSEKSDSPKSQPGVQLRITEFYRSTKPSMQAKQGEISAENSDNRCTASSKEKKREMGGNLSKSVRRRLLFN